MKIIIINAYTYCVNKQENDRPIIKRLLSTKIWNTTCSRTANKQNTNVNIVNILVFNIKILQASCLNAFNRLLQRVDLLYCTVYFNFQSWSVMDARSGGQRGQLPPQIMIEGQNMHFAPPPKKKVVWVAWHHNLIYRSGICYYIKRTGTQKKTARPKHMYTAKVIHFSI